MRLEEFNRLSKDTKSKMAEKALAWFVAREMINPFKGPDKEESEFIQIVLTKIMYKEKV